MGFFSSLLGRSDDYEEYEADGEEQGELPKLHTGMTVEGGSSSRCRAGCP